MEYDKELIQDIFNLVIKYKKFQLNNEGSDKLAQTIKKIIDVLELELYGDFEFFLSVNPDKDLCIDCKVTSQINNN